MYSVPSGRLAFGSAPEIDSSYMQQIVAIQAQVRADKRQARLDRQARSRSQQWKKSQRQNIKRVRGRAKNLWLEDGNVDVIPFLDGSRSGLHRIGSLDEN